MIGKLKGTIDSYGEDHIILDVHGVGYLVHCSAKTLTALPSPGEAAVLSIETIVREDMIKLFASVPIKNANGSACCKRCKVSAQKWRSRFCQRLNPAHWRRRLARATRR